MKLPEINGLEVVGTIGSGETGRVYLANLPDGRQVAVKVFEGLAVNRGLLARAAVRLEVGGWPEGVVAVESTDFEGRPACVVLPLLADVDDEGELRVRSLQHRLDDHPGEDSWALVREIGRGLAEMHRRRVAHGNLKPGNVFFDDGGKVLVGDWGLGNMPGIGCFEFTDALLYQAPEQLLEPDGYLDECGYRWDVFSFGVLAYRLLTGEFPRCGESFSAVAPVVGETRREDVHADVELIARNLRQSPEVVWPEASRSRLEEGYREWVLRCLALDSESRPLSMVEVMAGFDRVELEVAGEEAREVLMDQRRHAERSGRRTMFVAGMALAACAVLGGSWYLSSKQLGQEQVARMSERVMLEGVANEAVARRDAAAVAAREVKEELDYERELGLARLAASRLIGDRLFDWAMEKGHRRLPALDGRELRLKRLERFYEDFLRRTADLESLESERARVRLQLAEISLAAGDAEVAELRLDEAIKGWSGGRMDGEMKLRMGRNGLLLALLRQDRGQEGAGEAFERAREALMEVPQAEVDQNRLGHYLAVLDFHEAKLLAGEGKDARALEQLMGATKRLNELADARPDVAVLRSELAACYLSSAMILEGMGNLGDAREVRSLAAGQLVGLLEENPEDVKLRLELAGCYGAMAEASVLAGDVGAAEAVSAEAVELLEGLLREQPDLTVAAVRKAAQLGLRAGILRDKGEADKAMAAFDDGISLLERQGRGRDGMVDYRLALLWWQKGRMLGFDGKRNEELVFLRKARSALAELEGNGLMSAPRAEELQRSGAYLLGDLGHALELAKREDEAKEIFKEAVESWEGLLRARPESEEYEEALEWCRSRL